jgi:hypothetical protein
MTHPAASSAATGSKNDPLAEPDPRNGMGWQNPG